MGTATLAIPAEHLRYRWDCLLQVVKHQTENDPSYSETENYSAQVLAGLLKDQGGLWGSVWQSEAEDDEDAAAQRKPKAVKRKRDLPGSRANVIGGPCSHCGATSSPQWRRPADKDQTLCNACGIYYGRHRQLPRGKTKPATEPPAPSAAEPAVQEQPAMNLPAGTLQAVLQPTATAAAQSLPSSAAEILLRPVRAVRTRYPSIKGHSPTSSESHNEAHPTGDNCEEPSAPLVAKRRKANRSPVAEPAGFSRHSPSSPRSPSDSSLSSGHVACYPTLPVVAPASMQAPLLQSGPRILLAPQPARRTVLRGPLFAAGTSSSEPSSVGEGAEMNTAAVKVELPSEQVTQMGVMTQPQPMLLPVLRCPTPRHLLAQQAAMSADSASGTPSPGATATVVKSESHAVSMPMVGPLPYELAAAAVDVIMVPTRTCRGPRRVVTTC